MPPAFDSPTSHSTSLHDLSSWQPLMAAKSSGAPSQSTDHTRAAQALLRTCRKPCCRPTPKPTPPLPMPMLPATPPRSPPPPSSPPPVGAPSKPLAQAPPVPACPLSPPLSSPRSKPPRAAGHEECQPSPPPVTPPSMLPVMAPFLPLLLHHHWPRLRSLSPAEATKQASHIDQATGLASTIHSSRLPPSLSSLIFLSSHQRASHGSIWAVHRSAVPIQPSKRSNGQDN